MLSDHDEDLLMSKINNVEDDVLVEKANKNYISIRSRKKLVSLEKID